jgi:hypothetical protein
MAIACPVCEGRCGALFRREPGMSHTFASAHWDGECTLTPEAAAALFGPEDLADAIADLSAK